MTGGAPALIILFTRLQLYLCVCVCVRVCVCWMMILTYSDPGPCCVDILSKFSFVFPPPAPHPPTTSFSWQLLIVNALLFDCRAEGTPAGPMHGTTSDSLPRSRVGRPKRRGVELSHGERQRERERERKREREVLMDTINVYRSSLPRA